MSLSLNQGVNIVIEDGDQIIQNAIADLDDKINDLQFDVNIIEIKTDQLPADPSSQALIDAKLNNIDTDLTNINANVVNVHNDLIAADAKIDIIDANVDTLITNIEVIDDHLHPEETFVYPLTGVKTIEKLEASWGDYGTKVEIIPANAITKTFDIHFLNISSISANGSYHIGIYEGLEGAEILRHEFKIVRTSVQSQESSRNIITKLFLPNTRISAALKGSPATVQTIDVGMEGHPY